MRCLDTVSVKTHVSYKIPCNLLFLGLMFEGNEKGFVQQMEAKHHLGSIFETINAVKEYGDR